MHILKKAALAAVAALTFALPAAAAERAIIVLDGSGSMWAQIDGKARITIARETLSAVLADLPDDLELGFMTYGHREKGNCEDIELLVDPASGTGAAIAEAAEGINPKGMTPISDAVRLAAESLRFTEEKATVILITDGLETCEVDPCQLASELEGLGIDFTTHVLGFGLSDDEGQQVACLAENTGGQYLSAADGAGLVDALTKTVAQVAQAEPVPEPTQEPALDYNLRPTVALSEGGPDLADETYDIVWSWYQPAADGSEGEYVGMGYYSRFEGTLEPGNYILKVEIGPTSVSQPVTIASGKIAKPHFVLNAAILKLHPLPTEGAEVDADATTEIKLNGEYLAYDYGDVDIVVPAGAIEAIMTIGEATVSRTYSPKAGETIDEDVILGTGMVFFTTEYAPGAKVEDDIFMEIFDAKVALDGTRKSVSYGYNGEQDFELPAGDYVMDYKLDGTSGQIPFNVVTGERTDIPVELNAGVLAVTTPADDYVEIFSSTKDIAGNRKSFDYGYGPEFQTTLAAGDYVVFSKQDDVESETPLTIKAGERFELTIEPTPAGGKTK